MGLYDGYNNYKKPDSMKLEAVSFSSINDNSKSEKSNAKKIHKNTELKITKISQQVKRPDRFSVYVNEKYSFSLNEYQLANSGLRSGKVLSKDELENFANESQFGKAYERTLNYVMIRPRSEKEIKDYLTRTFLYPKPKVFTDKSGKRHIKPQSVDKEQIKLMIERVMQRLSEKGYINDESFAKSWVTSRQLHKTSSIRRLQQELYAKGISSDIISSVLEDSDLDDRNNLKEVIIKKRRLSRYQDNTKLMQYLLRQGFSYEDIKEELS